MRINEVDFNCGLDDILTELISQLRANNIQYIQKTVPTNTDIQICCPYHNEGMERRPSAGIRRSDGLFHCFACGEVHTLPEVISFCFGYTDDILGSFGWKWLLKNFATIQVEERKPIKLNITRNLVDTVDTEYVSEEELDSYRYFHPYMYERKLDDNIIELFDVGYDKKTNCITFPIRDKEGHCLFVARRSVCTKYFNYPNGVSKPLYGLYELYHSGIISKELSVIICESMLDALTCWVYGKPALALNGLGNELQFEQLRQLPVRKLILATDNDAAGLKARKRIRHNVKNKLITEYELPEGRKDINELTKKEFKELVEIF